jgi:GTP cyclohydrolase FolE2
MIKVPSPEDSQMPIAHLELSNQDKERIKGAHLSEATETLAKTMFISGARGALKSVLVRQNPTNFTEAIQTAMQMEQKWMKNKLGKARI